MSSPIAVQHVLAASIAAVLALTSPWLAPDPAPPVAMADADGHAQAPVSIADASMAFELNQGQTDEQVLFLSRGQGYSLFLTPGEAVFSLTPGDQAVPGDRNTNHRQAPAVLRMAVVGGNPAPEVAGEDLLAGKSHYLTGNDQTKWQRDVPQYGKVRYQQVYPGIDLVYYGNGGKLEYDFIVAAGEDPGQIALDFDGIQGLRIDEQGNLVLQTAHGDLLQHKPVVYQQIDGQRQQVEGAYTLLASNQVGFTLGRYDTSEELVIDPVLAYSTYLGGNGEDATTSIGVDRAGNTYVAGYTNSVIFPWDLGSESEFSGGILDAYVCKFNPAGSRPYCAYIGGAGDDSAWAVSIAPDGSAYVGGYTDSADFPVLFANNATLTPGTYGDAFLLKINPAGDMLEFSTYYGGNDHETIRAITVDAAGAAYVTGGTYSWEGFPLTTGVYQAVDQGGIDAFVAKFTATGGLAFSSLLGGQADDQGRGIALDKNGNILVTGNTTSADFPLVAPLQATYAGGGDAFLGKLNPSASALLYSTYHGGSGLEWGYGIALDKAGNTYLAGFTSSTDFPVRNARQPALAGGQDGFLSKFNASGSAVSFSSYVGGSGHDDLRHIELDPAGNVYLAGYTSSDDFPGSNKHQPIRGQDGVLNKFSPSGTLLETTVLGGSNWEIVAGMALDMFGNAHLAGYTTSADFPVAAAFQRKHSNPPATADEATNATTDIFLSTVGSPAMRSWSADFDGNGRHDILWRNNATGAGVIWWSANGATATNITRITDLDWQIVGIGDFNGSGTSDILWRHRLNGRNVIWDGGHSSASIAVTGVTNLNWGVAGIGDFNGDEVSDILWHNDLTGAGSVWYSGNYATRFNLTRVTNLAWDIVGSGDFNNDGKWDVLWRNTTTGQNVIWKTGDSRTQQTLTSVRGQAWQIAAIDDFDDANGDDILWRNRVTGANQIWKSANQATRQTVTSVTGQAWQIFGNGDYDGDGRYDILWRNTASGSNVIWRAASSVNPQSIRRVASSDWVPRS